MHFICISIDAEKMLFTRDMKSHTFVLAAAGQYGMSAEKMEELLSLPRQTALELSLVRGKYKKRPSDQREFSVKNDALHQMGLYSLNIYQLDTPPKVLVSYKTRTR